MVGEEDGIEGCVGVVGHVTRCGISVAQSAYPAMKVVVSLLKKTVERCPVCVLVVRHVFEKFGYVGPWSGISIREFRMAE